MIINLGVFNIQRPCNPHHGQDIGVCPGFAIATLRALFCENVLNFLSLARLKQRGLGPVSNEPQLEPTSSTHVKTVAPAENICKNFTKIVKTVKTLDS